jgi:hypothetical protein
MNLTQYLPSLQNLLLFALDYFNYNNSMAPKCSSKSHLGHK